MTLQYERLKQQRRKSRGIHKKAPRRPWWAKGGMGRNGPTDRFFTIRPLEEEEWEFAQAMAAWCKQVGCRYPDLATVFKAAQALGYRKVAEPTELPRGIQNDKRRAATKAAMTA